MMPSSMCYIVSVAKSDEAKQEQPDKMSSRIMHPRSRAAWIYGRVHPRGRRAAGVVYLGRRRKQADD